MGMISDRPIYIRASSKKFLVAVKKLATRNPFLSSARRQVTFELDKNKGVIERTYPEPNTRSDLSQEAEACWWTPTELSQFQKALSSTVRRLRKEQSPYRDAVHDLLDVCCERDASQSTCPTTLSADNRRSLAMIIAGKAHGIEYHISPELQKRRAESIQLVLDAQGPVGKQSQHCLEQRSNLIALQYRRASRYASNLSCMTANGIQRIVQSS